jgi:hypothetical protein
MLIQEEADLFLRTYGRGLSGKYERKALYDLLQRCNKHTQACSQAVRLVPFQAVLMSLILEQQKEILALIEETSTLSPKQIAGVNLQ